MEFHHWHTGTFPSIRNRDFQTIYASQATIFYWLRRSHSIYTRLNVYSTTMIRVHNTRFTPYAQQQNILVHSLCAQSNAQNVRHQAANNSSVIIFVPNVNQLHDDWMLRSTSTDIGANVLNNTIKLTRTLLVLVCLGSITRVCVFIYYYSLLYRHSTSSHLIHFGNTFACVSVSVWGKSAFFCVSEKGKSGLLCYKQLHSFRYIWRTITQFVL